MIDTNHGSGYVPQAPALSPTERVNIAIDSALVYRQSLQTPRAYLGGSRLGEPCSRLLCYELMGVPADEGREFTGRTLRIFEVGHRFEAMMADWLTQAGFGLRIAKRDGSQFGFSIAGGKIAGHIDGVITDGPVLEVPYPIGWEHKSLGDKGWSKIANHGLRLGNETYFGQVQIYMAYMDLPAFLFTAINKNDESIYAEIVRFDPAAAQALSDKAVTIVRAVERGELLSRIASQRDFYKCRMCNHQDRCWSDPN